MNITFPVQLGTICDTLACQAPHLFSVKPIEIQNEIKEESAKAAKNYTSTSLSGFAALEFRLTKPVSCDKCYLVDTCYFRYNIQLLPDHASFFTPENNQEREAIKGFINELSEEQIVVLDTNDSIPAGLELSPINSKQKITKKIYRIMVPEAKQDENGCYDFDKCTSATILWNSDQASIKKISWDNISRKIEGYRDKRRVTEAETALIALAHKDTLDKKEYSKQYNQLIYYKHFSWLLREYHEAAYRFLENFEETKIKLKTRMSEHTMCSHSPFNKTLNDMETSEDLREFSKKFKSNALKNEIDDIVNKLACLKSEKAYYMGLLNTRPEDHLEIDESQSSLSVNNMEIAELLVRKKNVSDDNSNKHQYFLDPHFNKWISDPVFVCSYTKEFTRLSDVCRNELRPLIINGVQLSKCLVDIAEARYDLLYQAVQGDEMKGGTLEVDSESSESVDGAFFKSTRQFLIDLLAKMGNAELPEFCQLVQEISNTI